MNVEIWKSRKFGYNVKVEDWAEIYRHPRNILLVETQEEYDFFWAMQMVYGGEVTLMMYDSSIPMIEYRNKTMQSVYTTWEPFDRNRI